MKKNESEKTLNNADEQSSPYVLQQLFKQPREEKRKVFQSHQQTTMDGSTGEVQNELVITSRHIGTEPEYIKMYIDDILHLSKIPQGLNQVLYALIKLMNYEGQIVLNSSVKKLICTQIGKSMATLDKALTGFVKEEVLMRVDKGIYLANPYLFGRGNWNDIKKIRLTIEWNSKGRFVSKPKFIEDEQQSSQEDTD